MNRTLRTRSPRSLPILVLPLVCAPLAAQNLTIGEGNTSFTTTPASSTLFTPRTFDLRGDALATDHGYEHWWYYRVAGDARELPLRAVGGMTGAVAPFGTHLDRDFANLENAGRLRAWLDADVYAAGPSSGVVVSRTTFQNLGVAPLVLDVFAYTDLDVAGSSGNDTVTGSLTSHVVTDLTGVTIEVRGLAADRSEVGVYPSVRTKLADALVDDLANVLPPFTGDYTGAFQWQARTLQPGESRTFTVVFAIETTATRVPVVEHYGHGSTTQATIDTDTLPLQDNSQLRQIGIHLRGAPPNAMCGLLTSTFGAAGLPFLGFDMFVDPSPPAQFPAATTTANGEMTYVFPIPPSPYLTGYPLYHQFFFVDPTAPNGVGGSTGGLLTRLGRL